MVIYGDTLTEIFVRNDASMAGIYERPREGTRGGRDQFKWDDVKLDKHRENYLGHSLQVTIATIIIALLSSLLL